MADDKGSPGGTLTGLLLNLLAERPMYGHAILREAERRRVRAFELKEGSLYPALHHMERAGLLKADWRIEESGRARKYYGLTKKGRRQAASQGAEWPGITSALRAALTLGA